MIAQEQWHNRNAILVLTRSSRARIKTFREALVAFSTRSTLQSCSHGRHLKTMEQWLHHSCLTQLRGLRRRIEGGCLPLAMRCSDFWGPCKKRLRKTFCIEAILLH